MERGEVAERRGQKWPFLALHNIRMTLNPDNSLKFPRITHLFLSTSNKTFMITEDISKF